MNDKKMQSNIIGARCLTRQEAVLILPTYDQIYDQLEAFRKEKSTVNSNDQKTNNIGIIGVRGAGKTSILKTIRAELERNGLQESKLQENRTQDIILPIIVPENMSESGTLMATVLGMLSDIVHKRAKEKKEAQKEKGAYCIGETELEQKCHSVLKQYTYIQKEYRDILIQQYTSENDYVRSSAKLFNSDTEFIKQFNELIDELVGKEYQNLLVLFIDDIDLSTWRCMDVVRTLLSYLANKSIVTFISGDLETFEEALTLEFLRQEKTLDGGIMEKSILAKGVNEKSLLESKKQLAYEYLKKILPPVYRHNIKEWSLEERGKYCIQNFKQKQDAPNLSELLDEALKDWINPAFFQYVESNGTKSVLPYTYHLFDNTSRGLNNIYNVLFGIVESKKIGNTDSEKKCYLKEKKQLLDTIIASRKVYNQYRNELNTWMITVGMSPESSKVYFDNAYFIIFGKEANEKEYGYKIKDPVERFSLFLFVDFAARLLYEGKYAEIIEKDEGYHKLKREAIWDLFWHPVIAEKVMALEYHDFINKEEEQGIETLWDVNRSFLEKGDLVLNLAYYKNLPLDRLLSLDEEEINSNSTPADLDQEVLSAFWMAVLSMAKISGVEAVQKLGEYYYIFKGELDSFLNTISTSKEQNVVIRLFDRECQGTVRKTQNVENAIYKQRILQNMIAELLKAEIGNDNGGEWEKVNSEKAWAVNVNQFSEVSDKEKLRRRVAVLKAIHEERLWRDEMAEVPIKYLEKELGQYLQYVDRELTREDGQTGIKWILDTSRAEEDWRKFLDSYDGVGETISSQTKQAITEQLRSEGALTATLENGISFNTCMKIRISLTSLATNNKVWYGQYEAWKVNNTLWEAWARPDEDWEVSEKYSYIRFLIQCCYRYKRAVEFDGENIEYAEMLQEIAKGISKAHGYAHEKVRSTFTEKLNGKLKENKEKPVDDEEFSILFS